LHLSKSYVSSAEKEHAFKKVESKNPVIPTLNKKTEKKVEIPSLN